MRSLYRNKVVGKEKARGLEDSGRQDIATSTAAQVCYAGPSPPAFGVVAALIRHSGKHIAPHWFASSHLPLIWYYLLLPAHSTKHEQYNYLWYFLTNCLHPYAVLCTVRHQDSVTRGGKEGVITASQPFAQLIAHA